MRTLIAMIAAATLALSASSARAQSPGQRAGGGLEYDIVSGDVDNGLGGYGYYEYDFYGPLSVRGELNYITGDFDLASGAGTYTSIGLGVALVARADYDGCTPYCGVGGMNHFNDFENVNYDNKLSLFAFGGARIEVGAGVSVDLSLRFRTLRVGADDKSVIPNEVNMDAWIVRAGLAFEL